MNIKEVEVLLGITRANIRYYEKEGLLKVERGENRYRNYSEADISTLKKIIVLRKVGVPVEDIRSYFNNEKSLDSILELSIQKLQSDKDSLNGSLLIAKKLETECSSDFDGDLYFEYISEGEKQGNKYIDLCQDIMRIELDIFEDAMKHLFFFDFKKHRQNAGVKVTVVILIGYLLLFGLAVGIGGFTLPVAILLFASLICLPVMLIKEKFPKAVKLIYKIIAIIALLFVIGIVIAAAIDAWIF